MARRRCFRRRRRDAETVLFVDGVRRIDARVWIDGDSPGICASYAAGAVRCDGRAEVVDIAVARGMFSTAATAADIVTANATYPARMAASNDIAGLMLAVHERMTDVEVGIAAAVDGADLVVIDGPLRGRAHIDHAIGFIKSHAVRYLPDELHRVVGTLAAGSGRRCSRSRRRGAGTRGTCGFLVRRERRGRASCGASARPTSRPPSRSRSPTRRPRCCPGSRPSPTRTPAAPQNLYPIGGLERELRHRLGDQALLYRSLRVAAATAG